LKISRSAFKRIWEEMAQLASPQDYEPRLTFEEEAASLLSCPDATKVDLGRGMG